jgi:RNA polymerase sigma-70 factor (ECF subfamily)
MHKNTDQYYIDRTLDGDTNAFSVLVTRYQDFVFTIAYRMMKSRADAEEVAQDAFLKSFQSLSSYRGESKFSSWLYQIVYRKALDRLRSNKKMRSVELIEEMTEDTTNDDWRMIDEDALHFLEEEEKKRIIQECLMSLKELDSAIITFYYFEELSVREIAEITELSPDNIKIRLHRSRKRLFTLLEQYIYPEISNNNGKVV